MDAFELRIGLNRFPASTVDAILKRVMECMREATMTAEHLVLTCKPNTFALTVLLPMSDVFMNDFCIYRPQAKCLLTHGDLTIPRVVPYEWVDKEKQFTVEEALKEFLLGIGNPDYISVDVDISEPFDKSLYIESTMIRNVANWLFGTTVTN